MGRGGRRGRFGVVVGEEAGASGGAYFCRIVFGLLLAGTGSPLPILGSGSQLDVYGGVESGLGGLDDLDLYATKGEELL